MTDRQQKLRETTALGRQSASAWKSLLPAQPPLPASKTKLRQLSISVTRRRTRLHSRTGESSNVAARRKAETTGNRRDVTSWALQANDRRQRFRSERKTGSTSRARRQRTEVEREGRLCFAPLCALEASRETASRLYCFRLRYRCFFFSWCRRDGGFFPDNLRFFLKTSIFFSFLYYFWELLVWMLIGIISQEKYIYLQRGGEGYLDYCSDPQ